MFASYAWLALVTVLGAPATTPATPAALSTVAASRTAAKPGPAVVAAPPTAAPPTPKVDLTAAVAAAEATLTAAKLPANQRDFDGAITRASGLDPDRLAAQLDAMTAVCAEPTGACQALQPHADLQGRLDRALGRLGAPRHAASLLRSSLRGSFEASQALDELRLRAMVEAVPRARCQPPTADELTLTATDLADFMVVRVRAGVLTAEPLTSNERGDLAYFMVSVGSAGREVGAPAEATRGSPVNPVTPGPPDQLRAALLIQLRAATHAGDLPAALVTGQRYLATLGYPAAMDSAADAEHAWGGPRHSFVMRELAGLAELGGDLYLAYDLYRRADPGGGMCGTSYWSYWKDQVGGVIRTAERLGDCRPAIAERLLDIDLEDSNDTALPDPLGIGTGRLTAAGFDVPRLFRGAMLTLGRDGEAALRRALEAAPAPLRSAALARLARRGREDWGRRVYAIEGLAATGDLRTLTALAALLDTLAPRDQARVAATIGEAAQRPEIDPCAPGWGVGSSSWSNMWSRQVPALGRSCKTSLTLAQSEALARALLPLVEHREQWTGNAAIEALGKIAVRSARPTLRKIAKHKPTRPCEDEASCAPHSRFQAATEALATLDSATTDPMWRKYDPKRGR